MAVCAVHDMAKLCYQHVCKNSSTTVCLSHGLHCSLHNVLPSVGSPPLSAAQAAQLRSNPRDAAEVAADAGTMRLPQPRWSFWLWSVRTYAAGRVSCSAASKTSARRRQCHVARCPLQCMNNLRPNILLSPSSSRVGKGDYRSSPITIRRCLLAQQCQLVCLVLPEVVLL